MSHDLSQHPILQGMPPLVHLQQHVPRLSHLQQPLRAADDVCLEAFYVNLKKKHVVTAADSIV
jgi:hypothetical protein